MAIETNGLKNYLSTLPQQSDVDCIIAMDANGNPIRIKKSDLAQVAAELIGTADANKNGLMSNEYYKKCIMRSFSVLTFIKLINMTGVWQRCFLNVNGMCHSQLVSFSVRIYTDGTVKNNYKFNIFT